METEISIKDLKGLELDENRLEEESNFLLNYDNDLVIAQLSESNVKRKEWHNEGSLLNENNEEDNNKNFGKIVNPLFNSKINLPNSIINSFISLSGFFRPQKQARSPFISFSQNDSF